MSAVILNKINVLEKNVSDINVAINKIISLLNSYVKTSDLVKSENSLLDDIKDLKTSISKLENKLSMIVLPNDTKYYLKQDEIQNFRNTVQQITAMMTSMEQLYTNVVAYTASK